MGSSFVEPLLAPAGSSPYPLVLSGPGRADRPICFPVIIHLNGTLTPLEQASISPLDRGFLLGDALYEGMRAFEGHVVALDAHIRRLDAGLRETGIDWRPDDLPRILDDLLAANDLKDAFVYWQVSRGAPRPGQPVRARLPVGLEAPTRFGYCVAYPSLAEVATLRPVSAVTVPDTRWLRGHIKSTSLIGNVLQAIEADRKGAEEAIFVRDGLVAEGAATNVFLVANDDGRERVVTPSLDSTPILEGVTRGQLLAADPDIVERPVRERELDAASEVMLVGTTALVTPVTRLNGRPVGSGETGPHTRRLAALLIKAIRAEHIVAAKT